MAKADILTIPPTLITPNKHHSHATGFAEFAVHKATHKDAFRLFSAFSKGGYGRFWVPLEGAHEDIALDLGAPGFGSNRLLYLIGQEEPDSAEKSKKDKKRAIHLATFSQVSHISGTSVEAPGVSLMPEIAADRLIALPSCTEEFQFVERALGVIREAAIAKKLVEA